MSKQIDEKVVSMKFDNKQFEANVKTSMSTIDKLKNSLNFKGASKGLEDLQKASKKFSFDDVAASVQKLENRFSVFGIAGMRVVERFTDSVLNSVGKISMAATSFITEGIVQGGKRRAMNLENAHFQLQGLLKDEEAVAAVMKNVSDSVDGTAYSLDSAAKVASQLAASGMKAGDQMFSSLRAVAGVAAMTNSEYDEIGRIFTKVAGQGRLMGDDLLSLSSRGMNAAATLAQSMGTTESAVREMVSKGQIDFKTFASAMDDAFGEHAKKANETLTGALSNVKAALARIGALFVSPLVEQNGELVQLLNNVRIKINDIKTALVPVADRVVAIVKNIVSKVSDFVGKLDVKKYFSKFSELFTSSKWDAFIKKLNDAGISTDKFQEKLKEVASKHGISIDDLIKKYGTLGKVMSAGKISKSIIIETLKKFVDAEKDVSKATTDVTDKLEYFNKIVNEVIRGNYGNGASRMKALADAGYDYAKVQKLINYVWERNGKTWSNCTITAEELTNTIGDLSTEELKSIGYTDEQAKKIRELAEEAEKTGTPLNELISSLGEISKPSAKVLIIDSLKNGLQGLMSIAKALKDAFIETFDFSKASGAMYSFLEVIHKISEKFVFSEERADKLKRTFKGLFAIIDILRMTIGGGLNIAFKVLKTVLSAFNIDVLDLTATVGDAIVKFRDWLKEHNLLAQAIEFLAPIIKAVATAIKEAAIAVYDWAKSNETIQKVLKTIREWFDKSSESIKKWVDGLKETDNVPKYIISGLVNGLKNGVATVVNIMIELGKGILDAIKGVLGIHSPSTEFFEIGKNVIAGFVNGIRSGASTAWEALKTFGQKCIDIIKNIDFGAVLTTVFIGGVLFTANKLVGVLDKFANPFDKLGGMFDAIGSGLNTMFTDIGKSFKAKAFEKKSKAILNFAISIGILAASIYMLAKLAKNDSGAMWEAFGMIAALAAVVGVLAVAVSRVKPSEVKKIGATLLALSSAMFVLALALKILGGMSWNQLAVAGAAMGGLMVIVAALIQVTKNRKNLANVKEVFGKIASAMLVLAIALKILGTMSWNQLAVAGAAMGGLMVIIAALIQVTKNRRNLDNVKEVFGKIASAMLVLAIALKILGTMSWKQLGVAGAAIGGLALIVAGLVLATKKGGKDISNIGKNMLAISGAIAILAVVVQMLGRMKWSQLAVAGVAMGGLALVVTGLMFATKKCGKDAPKIGSTLLAIAGAMAILALVTKILGSMSWDQLGVAAVGMIGLTLIVGYLVNITQKASKDAPKIATTLLAIAGAIAILAAVAVLLGLVKLEHLAQGVIAVAILGTIVAIILSVAKNSEKAMKPLIAMAALIGVLAGVLYLLTTIDSAKLLVAAASLGAVLLILAASLALVNNFGGGASTGAGLLLAATGLLAIAAAMLVLAAIPADKIGQSILLLVAALAALCGVAALFSVFAAGAGLMVGVLLSIAAVVVAVGIAAIAFAGALYIVGLALPLVADGLTKLITSLSGCVEYAGGFLATMAVLAAALTLIAIPLAVISVSIMVFAVALAVVAVSALIFAGALALISLVLPTIANGLQVLYNAVLSCSGQSKEFLTTCLSLSAGLSLLGLALVVVGAGVIVLGAGLLVVAVAMLGIGVAAMIFAVSLAVVSAVLPLIADGLTALGEGLNNFITSVAAAKGSMDNFSSVIATLGTSILMLLLKIAAGLVVLGAGAIVAGAGISVLGAALMVGSASITVLAAAFALLGVAMQNLIPVINACSDAIRNTLDGLAATFDSVFGGISDVITSVGDSIRNVLDGISGIIDSVGKAALNAGKGFEKLANGVKTITKLNLIDMAASMGAVALAIGKITSHSKELAESGKGMQQIANGTKLSAQAFTTMSTGIAMVTGKLSAIGSIANGAMAALKSSVAGTASCFVSMSTSAAAASSSVVVSISSMVTTCAGAAKSMAASFSAVGRALMSNLANGVRSGGSRVRAIMTSLLTALVSVAKSRAGQFTSIGRMLAVRFASGVKSGSSMTRSAFSSALAGAVSNARSYYGSFYSAGSYVAEGFADGIKANRYKAEAQARIMAQNAATAAQKALKINSPSKVFRAIAYSIPEGFAQGIDRKSWMVGESVNSMANVALNNTKAVISRIADGINSDIDAQPTIRPVLDLSDVESGAGAIGSMFGGKTLSVNANGVGTIAESMNRLQNGRNSDDVVSAINRLRKDMSDMPRNTYSINGITYDDGSNVSDAIQTLVRAAKIERRT